MAKIFNQVLHGYGHLEPIILSCLARRKPIFLEGAHGIGKSSLGTLLARAVAPDGQGYRFYSADKSNLVTLAGLPDMAESSKQGNLEFISSKVSIWGAAVVLSDELPRASKEYQNYWLEILENNTLFGLPITDNQTPFIVATGNNATYKGNFKFDIALKSRFWAWITAPKFESVESEDAIKMIRANRAKSDKVFTKVAKQIGDKIEAINDKYNEYIKNDAVVEQVDNFIGTYFQLVKAEICRDNDLSKHEEAFIPPREFANQFPELLITLASYYATEGHTQPFLEAANQAVRYNVITRHAAAGPKIETICTTVFRSIKGLLSADISTPAGRLTAAFASAISPEQKVNFWNNRLVEAEQLWDHETILASMGDTLQLIKERNIGLIGPFWAIAKQCAKAKQIMNEVSGFVITEIARKISACTNNSNDDGVANRRALVERFYDRPTLSAADIQEILNS